MPLARVVFLSCVSALTLSACMGPGHPVPPPPATPTTPAGLSAPAPEVSAPIVPAVPVAPVAVTPAPAVPLDLAARLSKLEAEVAGMKGQIGQMGPILEKMPALQMKLSELVTELQRIDARVASARDHAQTLVVTPDAPEKSAPKTLAPKPLKAVPMKPILQEKQKVSADKPAPITPVTPQPTAISAVRIGDDSGKTRVVLDTSDKTDFTYDLDNIEHILVVDVAAGAFTAPMSAEIAKSPLVAAYSAQVVEGGKSRLVLQLRAPISVAGAQHLNPNGDKGHRIVLDLVKAAP